MGNKIHISYARNDSTYQTAKNIRKIYLNGVPIEAVYDFKYETGINDFTKVTMSFYVSAVEMELVDE